eukprot:GDKJ01008099.1.p1 GENE.GDKJ01008099.1~~GDKJ01008099.1.p1  ORF type:complete len:172 (+),score=30.71 GDKJ01008099.1:38-553(+)
MSELPNSNASANPQRDRVKSAIAVTEALNVQVQANTKAVIENQEAFHELESRSAGLLMNSREYHGESRSLRRAMWWKSRKYYIIGGIVLFIIITLVIVWIAGGFESSSSSSGTSDSSSKDKTDPKTNLIDTPKKIMHVEMQSALIDANVVVIPEIISFSSTVVNVDMAKLN